MSKVRTFDNVLEKIGLKERDPKEVVRESQRELRKSSRDIEREIASLRRDEKRLIMEIKHAAKQGNTASTKVLAKSLVRLRAQTTKLISTNAQLGGVSNQMATSVATQSAAKAMGQSTKAMTAMHKAMKPQDVQRTMQQFAMENAKMDHTSEMMGDTMDDAMQGENEEEETTGLVDQVLDELGVEAIASAASAPRHKVGAPQQQQQQQQQEEEAEAAEAEALAQRLANLKS